MANTGESDFEEAKYSTIEKISRQITMTYVLNNNTWVLESGNELFETYIGQHTDNVKNSHLFHIE